MLRMEPTSSDRGAPAPHELGLHRQIVKVQGLSTVTGSVMNPDSLSARQTNNRLCPSRPGPTLSSPALTSAEIPSTGSKTGETALKSSWIRRLKSRDEPEIINEKSVQMDHHSPPFEKRATPSEIPAQASVRTCIKEVRGSSGNIEGLKNSEMARSLQDKALTNPNLSAGVRAKSNATSPDTSRHTANGSRHTANGQKDHGADNQKKDRLAIQLTEHTANPPSKSGFGPWINIKSASRRQEKSQVESERAGFNSRHISSSPVDSIRCRQVGEKRAADGTLSLTKTEGGSSTQAAAIASVSMGKPPLPPPRPGTSARSKFGLPPRPIGLKTHGVPSLVCRAAPSPSGMDMPFYDRDMPDLHVIGEPVQVLNGREGVSCQNLVDGEPYNTDVEETGGASFMTTEPTNTGLIYAEQKEHGTNGSENGSHLPVRRGTVDNCGVVLEDHDIVPVGKVSATVDSLSNRQSMSYIEDPRAARQWKNDRRESSRDTDATLLQRPGSAKGTKDAMRTETADLLSDRPVNDLDLELTTPETREPEIALRELKGNPLQPPSPLRTISSSETSCGTARSDRAGTILEPAPSASTTASFPWELYTEVAGASKKAREQFVEVYNRARDELKNQRTTHITSKVPDRETDDSPRPTSETGGSGCDVPGCMPERQLMESLGQPLGQLKSQRKLETFKGGTEQKYMSLDTDAKSLNIHLPGRDQVVIGQYGVCLADGKVQDLQGGKNQTMHGPELGAGPAPRMGQQVIAPSSLAMGSLNACVLRQSGGAVQSRHSEGFQKCHPLPIDLQLSVNPKDSHERESHCNTERQMNFEQRADTSIHNTDKGLSVNTGRQGFRGNITVKHNHPVVPSEVLESPQLKGSGRVAGEPDIVHDRQHRTTPLGKRPRGLFDEPNVSGRRASVAGKMSSNGIERPSTKPNVWLQRWHRTYHHGKGMQGHRDAQVSAGGQETVRCPPPCSIESKEHGSGVVLREREMEGTLVRKRSIVPRVEKCEGVEHIQGHAGKALPSAAAMAIVGTAARQFCCSQPQRKGSFAFWSGFGMPVVPKSGTARIKGMHSSYQSFTSNCSDKP